VDRLTKRCLCIVEGQTHHRTDIGSPELPPRNIVTPLSPSTTRRGTVGTDFRSRSNTSSATEDVVDASLVKFPWYIGESSRENAEKLLDDYPVGTVCIRMSK
jgi:hypothetical protein